MQKDCGRVGGLPRGQDVAAPGDTRKEAFSPPARNRTGSLAPRASSLGQPGTRRYCGNRSQERTPSEMQKHKPPNAQARQRVGNAWAGPRAGNASLQNSLVVPPRKELRLPGNWCWRCLRVSWSKLAVAPTYSADTLPSPPSLCVPLLLASLNPCPWHYLHLSASHVFLECTCCKAKLQLRRGSLTPACLPDHSSRAMATYTYTSRPRALPCQRRRYRDSLLQPEKEPLHYGNIMYDRRVIRGNTYALQTGLLPGQPDPVELQKQQQARKRALAKKRAQEQLKPRTPEPIEGRKHVDVQTELYLEEIADHKTEVDMECQTDAFLDRPPTPLFIPAKTNKDVATEILEGELFDFDLEVKPMLEVLVGKTIEQSLLEVMEEEELANLQASQCAYEEMRNVELAEVQRLEEQKRRHQEEKERRKRQQWEIVHNQNETSQKVAACAFARQYLADLLPSVFSSLRDSGYFYDPIKRDVEIGFLPWLMNEVEKAIECSMVGRTVLDMLIRDVVEKRLNSYERKDGPPPSEWEDGLDVPGAMRDPTANYVPQELSTPQAQQPLSDTESSQATSNDRRPPTQERRLMEEEELLGPDEESEMRRSLDMEEPGGASEL
ncbi:LOW QUALITY PROTEIN: radial spoke head protein 3 homolog [Erethizon dorsatum]